MRHAHAIASAGRWAGPGVGVAAETPSPAESARAATTVDGASEPVETAACTSVSGLLHSINVGNEDREAAATPNPDTQFQPFVLVRIPYDQSTYPNGGEVLGVSNHGEDLEAIAVGYVIDDDEAPQPFMFTAATNTVAMLDMDDGAYEQGVATSISPNGDYIAGWAYHTSSGKYRAVVWKASTGYQINATLSPPTDSRWNAVNNGGVPAGAYDVSGVFESVVGNQTPGYPFSGSEGEAKGINSNGRVCGWYEYGTNVSHAYQWDALSGGFDVHPSTQGYGNLSGANCINSTYHIGGWVINEYGRHISAHWIPMSIEGVHYEVTAIGGGDSVSHEVVAINSNKEMLINRVDAIPGIALWIDNSVVNEAVLIDTEHDVQGEEHLILMPNPDDHIWNGHCLSDDLWIGGSYLVHGEGDPQPCLAIPYDVNNNEVPDFREIVESKNTEGVYVLDKISLTWLIDKGENVGGSDGGMRIGLNQPGYSDSTNEADIANVQVVRLPLGVHNPDFDTADEEDFYVNGILDTSGQSQCSDFQNGLNLWREGREIVLTLRSNLDDSDPDHDYLPTAPNVDLGEGVTKQHLLTNLHWFGYKFARCVDWIQLGNESFSSSDPDSYYYGHGGYKIWAEEVGDCWTTGNDPREFEEITCPFPAIEAVQAWHYEQMWAILEGSALAGRPLRIIGPAIPMDTIINFHEEDTTVGWKVIDRTAKWGNDYQVWFDMHARYLVRMDVGTAKNYLTSNPGLPPWTVPSYLRLVCLELAPKLDETIGWWTGGGSEKFDRLMGDPECDAGNGTWENFLLDPQTGWHRAQFNTEVEFGWGDAVAPLYSSRFTIVCYGSTLQVPVPDPLWDLPALRCQNACAENFPNNTPQFSPLKTYYQNAAVGYQIPLFNPHGTACDSCGGN